MISQYVDKDNIRTGYEAKNWKEAVRASGEILKKNDFITEDYIDAMIEMVEDKGAYIVITPGLALPHARPEKGAKENGLSILILKNPIEFGHSQNDPVSVVISFCAVDDSSHSQMLSELANFLRQKENIEYIKKVDSKEKILNYFKKYDRGGEK